MRGIVFGIAAALVLGLAAVAGAETTVRIANIGHGYYAGPLYAALQEKLFEKHGLRAEVTSVKGGSLALQSVLSKQADAGILSYEHILTAAARGQRVVAIFNMVERPLNNLIVKNELAGKAGGYDVAAKVRLLKGLRVAVPSAGGSGEKMLAVLARRYGLSLPGDISMVYLGSDPGSYVAAFQRNLVDAALAVEPAGVLIEQAGEGKTLLDLMAGEVPEFRNLIFMTLAVHPDTIAEKPELLSKLARVFAEAMQIVKDPQRGRAVMAREYPDMAPATNARAYEVMNAIWSASGRMSEEQGRAVLDYLQPKGTVPIEISKTFTNQFLPR